MEMTSYYKGYYNIDKKRRVEFEKYEGWNTWHRINFTDEGKESALNLYEITQAAKNGQLELVKSLFHDSHLGVQDGSIAIRYAADNGHFDIVKFLVDNKCDPRIGLHDQAFCNACRSGHYDIAKYLIKKGCFSNATNYDNIKMAARNGHLNIVKLVVEEEYRKDKNHNFSLRNLTDAMSEAAGNGQEHVVCFLYDELMKRCYQNKSKKA